MYHYTSLIAVKLSGGLHKQRRKKNVFTNLRLSSFVPFTCKGIGSTMEKRRKRQPRNFDGSYVFLPVTIIRPQLLQQWKKTIYDFLAKSQIYTVNK